MVLALRPHTVELGDVIVDIIVWMGAEIVMISMLKVYISQDLCPIIM